MTDRHDSDDLLHRLLAESAWAFEPEEPADVDALLDAADAEQLNDDEVERILHGTAALRCGAGTTLRPSDVSAPGASVNSHARNDVSPQKEVTMKTLPPDSANQQSRSAGTALVVVVCACVMLAVGLFIAAPGPEKRQTADQPQEPKAAESVALVADSADAFSGTSAGVRPEFQTTGSVEPGTTIQTGARERQRLTLADGSILYVNENASLVVETDRKIRVRARLNSTRIGSARSSSSKRRSGSLRHWGRSFPSRRKNSARICSSRRGKSKSATSPGPSPPGSV